MSQSKKFCKKCGTEITDPKARKCSNCNAKLSKPIFKKWWFWVLIALGVIIIGSFGSEESPATTPNDTTTTPAIETTTSGKEYTQVDLRQMIDELDENALRAESKYQNMYVEVTGTISNFDSDGTYISIKPINADEWDFTTVMCYIKNNSQREILLNKSKGDTVVIKGKIFSIGEILGYSINIDEIS